MPVVVGNGVAAASSQRMRGAVGKIRGHGDVFFWYNAELRPKSQRKNWHVAPGRTDLN